MTPPWRSFAEPLVNARQPERPCVSPPSRGPRLIIMRGGAEPAASDRVWAVASSRRVQRRDRGRPNQWKPKCKCDAKQNAALRALSLAPAGVPPAGLWFACRLRSPDTLYTKRLGAAARSRPGALAARGESKRRRALADSSRAPSCGRCCCCNAVARTVYHGVLRGVNI
ncbi:unnamed protein product [Lampetra planeri]